MATWIEILGYTSSGTLLGLLAKAVFDALHAERAHILELRRHYFDKKLDLTIKGLTDTKMLTSSLRSLCALYKKGIDSSGSFHPQVISTMSQGIAETAMRLKQSDLTASASFGFLYGKLFFTADDEMRKNLSRISDLMSELMRKADTTPELLSRIKTCDKAAEMLPEIKEILSSYLLLFNQLDSEAQSLDNKLDEFTEKVSASFGKLRV